MKDPNQLLVAEGPEGFVRSWKRLVSEASEKARPSAPARVSELAARAGAAAVPAPPPALAPVPAIRPIPVVSEAPPKSAAKEENLPPLVLDESGTYVAELGPRTWRVRGLSSFGVDRLRVNVRVDQAQRFHVDTFDLYSARSRSGFVEAAVRALRLDDGEELSIADEIGDLIQALEKERLSLRAGKGEAKEPVMSATERDEALAFLRSPDLVDLLKADFVACGCVGEETALLIGYFALVSRKLAKPLSVLFCARSGAGKSMLQDRLSDFCPPEDLVKYTRISGQALFYKEPEALRHRLIVVEEEDGASQAAYALRSLISSGVLRASVTRTDPKTGRQVAEDYVVNGPVVVFLTSAHPEVLDYESRNRFVLLTVDESREQTRRILKWQRWEETAEGLLSRNRARAVQRKHQNAQRLIEPLEVVIPVDLPFPEDHLILRREQKKYHQLLKAIALLHQHQRPRKTMRAEGSVGGQGGGGGQLVEYIEVTDRDVEIASGLSPLILSRNLDELAPPTRSLYVAMRELVREKRKAVTAAGSTSSEKEESEPGKPRRYVLRRHENQGKDADDERLLLDRREIVKATGLSYWHVRTYMPQLVECEYVAHARGPHGRTLYRLLWEGDDEPMCSM